MSRPKKAIATPHRVVIQLSDEELARLNSWRQRQPDPPPRTTAIRRFVEIGLAHELAALFDRHQHPQPLAKETKP